MTAGGFVMSDDVTLCRNPASVIRTPSEVADHATGAVTSGTTPVSPATDSHLSVGSAYQAGAYRVEVITGAGVHQRRIAASSGLEARKRVEAAHPDALGIVISAVVDRR